MACEQLFIRFLCHRLEVCRRLLRAIAADVAVVHEVGGAAYEYGGGGCALHFQRFACGNGLPVRRELHHTVRRQSALHALLLHVFHRGGEGILLHAHRVLQGTVVAERHVERAGLARLYAHHYDAVGHGGEGGARICHPCHVIACRGGGVGEVKVAVVVCCLRMTGEGQLHAAHGEEAHTVRAYHEILVYYVGSRLLLAAEDELPHLVKALQRACGVVAMRASAPEGLIVDLQLLGLRAAEVHGSEVRVTKRKGLKPARRWTAVPQLLRHSGGGADEQQ